MMSSEEESDSHGSSGDKLLKKQKRARQRVDAGEPRNSYACIPNYTSRAPAPPAGLMSGGLYGAVFSQGRQHFGLLGPAPAAYPPTMLNELLGRAPKQEPAPALPDEAATRVLREILHGRKKELHLLAQDNNNVLANNNNDEPPPPPQQPTPGAERDRDAPDDSRSLPSPGSAAELVAPKLEPDEPDRASPARCDRPPLEVKRARVETIVSTMRCSPVPPAPQVNGCKKRKLYQPQQHDAAERRPRRAPGDSSEDEPERPPFQRKLVEKSALESQLRTMQEQLAEMQSKYLQLCSRVERGSDSPDDDASEPDRAASRAASPRAPSPAPPPAPALARPPSFPLPEHAAAVYLNVSQKLFLEQEAQARLAHAADHFGPPQHQQHQQHQQHVRSQSRQCTPTPPRAPAAQHAAPPAKPCELAERLEALRGAGALSGAELEGLVQVLKSEITASLASLVDSIVSRFVHQRRMLGQQSEAAAAAAERLNKDLLLASRLLERSSPSAKERAPACPPHAQPACPALPNGVMMLGPHGASYQPHDAAAQQHARAPTMFPPPKPPSAPALYALNGQWGSPHERDHPEQHEALSLVMTPKKKRHKVTDTRITPRTVSRLLGEPPPADSPSPRPMPLPPAYLPTSVAIPNPSLHESQVFSPYSPFFGARTRGGAGDAPAPHERDSPPLPHAPALLHPALLAAARRAAATPDYLRHLPGPCADQLSDPPSDCASTDLGYDGVQPTSSTLTPMHLRKAKLMFFWVRYPSSAVLKMYFPDIKFNKNNTAQLVKWFSNFREFYYIQMEKYARQSISEGAKAAEELHVLGDSEIYRVLNLHYNRNNHIEVPSNFRYVVEQTLREFFRAIQGGKDTEQSWKKSIYKIISRLDDPVPEYFKSPNFLEQLE